MIRLSLKHGAQAPLKSTCLAVLALLTACGGGGGGGSSSATLSTTPVALTTSNYQTAASEVVSSANYVTSSTSLASGIEAASASTGTLVAFAKSQLKSLGAIPASTLPTGATSSATVNCTTGTMTVSVNVAGSALAAGDSATFTMNNCYDGPTNSTYNGSFSINVTSLSGDFLNSYLYTIGLNFSFANFTAVTGSTRIVGNGSLSASETSTALYSSDASFNAASFAASATYASTTHDRQLTNFAITQSVRPNTPTSAYKLTTTFSGTVSSTALGGNAVTVSTVTPFVQLSTDLYPYTGQAIATGSANSKVRLTAQSASSVFIELDANADGTYEASVTKAWSAL